MKGPKALTELMDTLQTLPGVGRKTAERMAFHILKSPGNQARKLAESIMEVKEKVLLCSVCFSFTEKDPCQTCQDPERDKSVICVVEEPHDVYSIERVGDFNGVYHALMGALSPLDGVGPEELKVAELVKRVNGGGVKEVIIATNPNVEGEATAMYIAKALAGSGALVTRIARGLPVGGELEYADEMTLARALSGRLKM